MDTNIKPGFLLYRSKGFVEHAGAYLGNGQVLHNSPSGDVEIVSFTEYANGQEVKIIETGEHDQRELAQRLTTIIGANRKYHVSANNCEHIAHLLIYGRHYSPQIQATIAGAILGGLFSWKTGKGNPFAVMVIGGIAGCFFSNSVRGYDAQISPT